MGGPFVCEQLRGTSSGYSATVEEVLPEHRLGGGVISYLRIARNLPTFSQRSGRLISSFTFLVQCGARTKSSLAWSIHVADLLEVGHLTRYGTASGTRVTSV